MQLHALEVPPQWAMTRLAQVAEEWLLLDLLIAFDAVFIGCVASGYTHAAFDPTLARSWHDLSIPVSLAWLGVPGLLALFALKAALQRARHRLNDSLIEGVKREFLQTLSRFGVAQDAVHRLFAGALSRRYDKTAASEALALVRADIRPILASIASMVEALEPEHPGIEYAANIMRFIPRERLTGKIRRQVESSLQFEDKEQLRACAGVLYLEPCLSNSTRMEAADEDPNIRALALIVPTTGKTADGKRWQMLPGAPHAFMERAIWGSDCLELIGMCRGEEWSVVNSAAEKLEAYFGTDEGRTIQSVVSIPLMYSRGKQPKAVLNIHSNRPGLLKESERREQLYYLVRPAGLALLKLLELLDEHERGDRAEEARRRRNKRQVQAIGS